MQKAVDDDDMASASRYDVKSRRGGLVFNILVQNCMFSSPFDRTLHFLNWNSIQCLAFTKSKVGREAHEIPHETI